MQPRTIRDIEVQGKRVLVRVDFDVPIVGEPSMVTDDTRMRAVLPTLEYLLVHGAKLIVCSHRSPPSLQPTSVSNLRPVAVRLGQQLHRSVKIAPDCIGPTVKNMTTPMQPGDVLLLENLWFHPEEAANDVSFAQELATLAEIYVNEAPSVAQLKHASIVGVAALLPAVAGLLMEHKMRSLTEKGGLRSLQELPGVMALLGPGEATA